MTVYKAIRPEAEAAAELAHMLLTGQAVPAAKTGGKTVNNGKKEVPSVLLSPVAVTKANVQATIIADGFWTKEQVCAGAYAEACGAAGI
jgi:D-xylose transport system substrate-binding protein